MVRAWRGLRMGRSDGRGDEEVKLPSGHDKIPKPLILSPFHPINILPRPAKTPSLLSLSLISSPPFFLPLSPLFTYSESTSCRCSSHSVPCPAQPRRAPLTVLVEVKGHESFPDGGGGEVALLRGRGGEQSVKVTSLLNAILEGA